MDHADKGAEKSPLVRKALQRLQSIPRDLVLPGSVIALVLEAEILLISALSLSNVDRTDDQSAKESA